MRARIVKRIPKRLRDWFWSAAMALAVLASLLGCGKVSGEVVDLNYEPSYVTYRTVADYRQDCVTRYRTAYRTTYSGTGKYRTSHTSSYTQSYNDCRSVWVGSHQEPWYHPSCHRVTVRTDKGKTRSRCVSESRYYSLNRGDRFEG